MPICAECECRKIVAVDGEHLAVFCEGNGRGLSDLGDTTSILMPGTLSTPSHDVNDSGPEYPSFVRVRLT